tara:strand:- start:395 stop:1042 length:648 start_codon:yes stop_codon:yes gene_type:complete
MNIQEYKKLVATSFRSNPQNLPYYIVYDDFLPDNEYGALKTYLSSQFPWGIESKLNHNDQNPYFVTLIHDNQRKAREEWNPNIDVGPFVYITEKLYILALLRIKANMYLPHKTNDIHYPHCDYDFAHQGALYYLGDCDAPTYMADGVGIESKGNRLLLFNASTPHSSSAPTNTTYRQTININYFGLGIQQHHMLKIKHPTIVSDHVPFPIRTDEK